MMRLEDLTPNAAVRGILPDCLVTVVSVQCYGSEALELTYKTPEGKLGSAVLYRDNEPALEVAEQGRGWKGFRLHGAPWRGCNRQIFVR